MMAMRFLSQLFVLLALVLSGSPAFAQEQETMTVKHVALDGDGGAVVVAVEAGLLLFDEPSRPLFMCAAGWTEQGAVPRWVTHTGSGRVLIAGSGGAFVTEGLGCAWARTSGPVDSAHVVGLHAPAPGGAGLLFVVTDDTGPDLAVRSDDGGYTSMVSGGLSVLDVELTSLAGDDERAVVLGQDAVTGGAWAWRTVDGGLNFEIWDVEAPDGARAVALSSDVVWLQLGDAFHGVDFDTGLTVASASVESVVDVAADWDGGLWLVTGHGDLLLLDPAGDLVETHDIGATFVTQGRGESTAGTVWVGLQAAAPGEPLVVAREAGESDWQVVAERPSQWRYPDTCATRAGQRCAAEELLLVPAPIEAPSSPETGPDDSGCASGSDGGDRGPWGVVWNLLASLGWVWLMGRRNGQRTASP